MITIRIFSKSLDNFVPRKKVSLHDSWGHRSGTTNSSGSIDFEVKSGRYKVYVDGKLIHDGPLIGATVLYI